MGVVKRRMGIAAAGLAAASMALAACGGGGAASGSSGNGVTDTTADKGLPVVGDTVKYDPNTLVNNGEPITLEFWQWADLDTWQQLIDAYTKIHPNVTITLVNQPWDDFWTKLPLAIQGGTGPTLFGIHNSQESNLLPFMEPYDIPVADLEADYPSAATHVIDGKIYYTDFGLMSGAIYYNTDMWAAAGLTDADIPETWDQMREVAKKLTIRDGDTLVQSGFNFNSTGEPMQAGLAYQLGQNLFKSDETTPDVDNQANLDVINMLLGFVKDGSDDPNFGSDSGESFGQGQSAMTYQWGHFGKNTLEQNYPDLKWSTFRTPVPQAGETPYAYDRYNGESTFGINAKASDDQKAVAQDFLKFFLTDADFQTQLCDAYGVFPAYNAIADAPELQENPALTAFDDIDRYVWPGAIPAVFTTAYQTMWQDILYNGVAPEDALATAQNTLDTGLASAPFTSVENLYSHYEPGK